MSRREQGLTQVTEKADFPADAKVIAAQGVWLPTGVGLMSVSGLWSWPGAEVPANASGSRWDSTGLRG